MGCYSLIPSWDSHFTGEKGECLLPDKHIGYHLTKLNKGSYLSWGGNGCDDDCEWCGECFCWRKIDENTAKAIIAGEKKNFDG